MNILLVRPPDPLQHVALLSHTRPMNLAYLAAWLRRAGFEVALVDYEVTPFAAEEFVSLLRERQPDVVALSSVTPTIAGAARIAALAKAHAPGCLTVVGGAHANGLPVETLEEYPAFDVLAYGEGERTLEALCQASAAGGGFAEIEGLVWRRGGEIVRNPPRSLLDDLDLLPFPARDLFTTGSQSGHASRGFSNALRTAELFTSRGCPFPCGFCAIQATFGRNVRYHGLPRVEAEVKELVERYGCEHLVIADDTFTLQPERAAEVSRVIGLSGIASWNCDTRVSAVTPELLRLMKQSGCTKVAFGVESGSQRVMDRIGKKITVEQVERAVRWAREAGIPHIEGNFILGADPSETPEDLAQTRRMILSLPWTFVSVAVIVPYPGTPVFERMRQAGQLEPGASWEDFVMFGRPPRWRTDHFSAADLVVQQRRLTRGFYLRPGYVLARLREVRSWRDVRYWLQAGVAFLRWSLFGRV